MILILDFGSQTAHLIKRRIKELGAAVSVTTPDTALQAIKKNRPEAIIFSGGPASVYATGSPTIDTKIFSLGIPILAICYGMQLTAHLLGGNVKPGNIKEFGPATLHLGRPSKLFDSVPAVSRVWMSHGDTVVTPPAGFLLTGRTDTIAAAGMTHEAKNIYCVQFHPEVEHTEYGTAILKNFLLLCGIRTKPKSRNIKTIVQEITKNIGNHKAIAAVSGGLDSTVAATLVARAIGKNLIPVHIESGLMRPGTTENVKKYFSETLHLRPRILNREKEFLTALKGVTDPEKKRKIIGGLYIDFFEEELAKHSGVRFLVQGTIYSDVIESKGTKYADTIKSHHNVGGLPKRMKLRLLEPIRDLYTDEVRLLAKKLLIPDALISQQPHPGPGYAIRIVGEVTRERLDRVRHADQIVVEEMQISGWYQKLLHSFAVATGAQSTAVRGDGRTYAEVMAVRAVISSDRMTATWAHLPSGLLQKISSRIVNEVSGVSRVVYDITTKPPATLEWE